MERTIADIQRYGAKSVGLVADLSVGTAARALYEQTQEGLGRIDILVCNASVQNQEPWQEVNPDRFDRQVCVNLRSTFELMQLVAPEMERCGWGRIVTIGSVQELRPHPEMTVYAATKCAQTSLVRSLAQVLSARGVTVNNIAPGVIDTDRNVKSLSDTSYQDALRRKIPVARIGQPEDCASTALLLCSDAGSYITGQSIYVDGGMSL